MIDPFAASLVHQTFRDLDRRFDPTAPAQEPARARRRGLRLRFRTALVLRTLADLVEPAREPLRPTTGTPAR